MNLILNDLAPIHWAAAGAGIAAVTVALLWIANRRLGISTGFEDVCSLVLSQPYFRRGAVRSTILSRYVVRFLRDAAVARGLRVIRPPDRSPA